MLSADILDDIFFQKMLRTIRSKHVDVVVFDPLVSFHCQDENSNTAMRKVMDRFSLLGSETNTNVLVVHHDGKADSSNEYSGGRGASAICDWARNTFEFKVADKTKNTFNLRHVKASNFEKIGTIALKRGSDLRYYLHEENTDERRIGILEKVLEFMGGEVSSKKELSAKYSEYCVAGGLDSDKLGESQVHGLISRGVKLGKFQEIKEGKSFKIVLAGNSKTQ